MQIAEASLWPSDVRHERAAPGQGVSPAVTKTFTGTEARAATGVVFPEFLRPHEAATVLRLSVRTLGDYRTKGGGPAYFVIGKHVAYARTDLAKWAAARRCWNTAHADAVLSGPKP